MTTRSTCCTWATALTAITLGVLSPAASAADAQPAAVDRDGAAARHVYFTSGVHNDKGCHPAERCVAKRQRGEPVDPLFPKWWSSDWTMYRVFNGYDTYPPPYASPPAGLTPADYEVSYGSTYYDSTYVPPDGDGVGAMMEHYVKRCLPIFPFANTFTCSFVSLGNKAYFLRYDDRPPGTPACCQFSLQNHPPRRDFIKHLPYNATQSAHLGGSVLAYSRTVGPQMILFGYAFEKQTRKDSVDKRAAAYHHPQSFFFSGSPTNPPNAPIVSQNYTRFRMQKPNPGSTWNRVKAMCSPEPEWCCLFDGDCPAASTPAAPSTARRTLLDWATLDAADPPAPAPR